MDMHENFNVKSLEKIIPIKTEKITGEKITSLKFLGGGSYGRVFRAEIESGKIFAVKAYKRKDMHLEEAAQLKILSENTDVPMPKVLFTYDDEEVSLIAMTFIDGRNVLDPRFILKSKKQKQAFSKAVIKGMLSWHEVKSDKFGSLNNPDCDTWKEYYEREILNPVISKVEQKVKNGKFKQKELDFLLNAREMYNKIGDTPTEAVLIHGDLNIMNIMADPKNLSLTGFIDPCGCMFASREYDLYQLRNMWGDKYGLYEEYKRIYPLSKEADFRVAFFGAINELHCLFKSGDNYSVWKTTCYKNLKREMKRYL